MPDEIALVDGFDTHRTVRDIRSLISCELQAMADLLEHGQSDLAYELGYQSQGSASKLLSGRQRLPRDRAVLFDQWCGDNDHQTLCGESMVDLVDALRLAERAESAKTTDVFLASPMSAGSPGNYEPNRKLAMGLVKALRKEGLRTYFAGEKITKPSKFESHDLAYKANLRHIEDSRLFVLYLPPDAGLRPSEDAPIAPSSVWIEFGMALARGLPCTVFAPGPAALPFIVRKAVDDAASGHRVLEVHLYDDPGQPARLVKNHGRPFLLGGANGSRT